MTLPASGAISLTMVMNELRTTNAGRAYPISLGDADVRALAGVPSGPISLTDLYNKGSYVAMSGQINNIDESSQVANPANTYNYNIPVDITVNNGKGPFSFAWVKTSGGGTLNAANSASVTVTFSNAKFSTAGQTQTCNVQCTVTDNLGNTMVRTGFVKTTLS